MSPLNIRGTFDLSLGSSTSTGFQLWLVMLWRARLECKTWSRDPGADSEFLLSFIRALPRSRILTNHTHSKHTIMPDIVESRPDLIMRKSSLLPDEKDQLPLPPLSCESGSFGSTSPSTLSEKREKKECRSLFSHFRSTRRLYLPPYASTT